MTLPSPVRCLLVTLTACLLGLAFLPLSQGEDPSAGPLVETAPLAPEVFADINNSARGLAGLHASSDNGSVAWQETPEWHEYQEWLDHQWSYLDRVRLDAMRNWGNAELSGLRNEEPRTVFYPFSGPDVLYANTLFPHSKVLVMAGLEPVGTMPHLAKLQEEGKLGSYLHGVKTSLITILTASFFKTKDMKNDFNNETVDGLVPAIAVFLAREGFTIENIQYVTLDHDGTLSKGGKSGVQITYDKGDRDNPRVLLYFQADLGNDGLRENPGYVHLMHRLGPGVTYLKAASYLLYEDYFSTIRNAILDDSLAVVEDDSGIPLRYFKSTEWDVKPYGNYTGPIPLFKDHYQPDLAEFYAKNSPSSLSFGSGYKFTASVSSLLVARKK